MFNSEIFEPLFNKNPGMKEQILSKIVPIAGDLTIENLGISAADRAMVTAEAEVVINVAASVNFVEPLLDALQINYFGCERML